MRARTNYSLKFNQRCFCFKCDNLGRLLTVRIGCEGTCKTSNWFMDTLLIRNSLTGHIWKFPCAQWIGLGAEDSSGGVSKFISFFEPLF